VLQNYYLTKDLITCVALFVAIPVAVAIHNENMRGHIRQRLLTCKPVKIGRQSFGFIKRMVVAVHHRENQVSPIFVVQAQTGDH
jgi:hypothetical protein